MHYIDQNFSCPAFFHEGSKILMNKMIICGCYSKFRGIAASFVPQTSLNSQNAFYSSFYQNNLDNSTAICHICCCMGNCNFENNNVSHNQGNYPGPVAIYLAFGVSESFCYYFNNTKTHAVIFHHCMDNALQNVANTVVFKNSPEKSLEQTWGTSTMTLNNCVFFENTVYKFETNPIVKNSYSDKILTDCQPINNQIISTYSITTDYGIKTLKFDVIQSCIQNNLYLITKSLFYFTFLFPYE